MKYKLNIVFFFITFSILLSCKLKDNNSVYLKMIEHILNDGELVNDLWCVSCIDINLFSVHPLMNPAAWHYEGTSCLYNDNRGKAFIDSINSNFNINNEYIVKYSSAIPANTHIFFTERYYNLQAMIVFYREIIPNETETKYLFEIEIYNHPNTTVFRLNQGVIYIFEYNDNSSEINLICREKHHYD